jgi:hypothetical protein
VKNTWFLVMLSIAVAAFLWFIWPTPWRYNPDHTLRFHRLTGRVQARDAGRRTWRDTELIPNVTTTCSLLW